MNEKYTKFEKEKLGKTFQYYRQLNKLKWEEISQKSSVSKNIYSKMSKGKIFKNEIYYDEYLNLFHLTYQPKENFENWLNQITSQIKEAFEIVDEEKIKQLKQETINELEDYKDYPIYQQYNQIFNHLFRYYADNAYLTKEEIESDILLLESQFIEKDLRIFLIEVMYTSNNNSIGNYPLKDKIIELIKEDHEEPILLYVEAVNDKCDMKLQNALEKFTKAINYWDIKKNDYRKTKNLIGKFMILENIDLTETEKLIPELIKCKKHELPILLKNTINYNIAMFYYMNQRYEEAYPLFIENIEKYNGLKEIIFIGSICTHINRELPDCFTINYENSSYKLYIDYFKKKQEGKTTQELVDYIMYKLLYEKLIYVPYAQPLWRIYEYELYTFFKSSKKYGKFYIQYKDKLEEICKYK
ncbi:MAG: hypothetical protein ACI4U3_03205 [Traorella sp.]